MHLAYPLAVSHGTKHPWVHVHRGRFPFNQNVRCEFLATSSSEWNSIFQNCQKKENLARYTQIFENVFPEVFFPFNFAPRISRIFG